MNALGPRVSPFCLGVKDDLKKSRKVEKERKKKSQANR
jgi:hypothetical protein